MPTTALPKSPFNGLLAYVGRPGRSAGLIPVRVTRPFFLHDHIIEAGRIIELAPLDAAQAVASTRAEFVNKADRATAIEAARREDERVGAERPGARVSFWTRRQQGE